jgi:hypothetical protein
VLIECSETPSIRSSPTRSIYLTWNYLHSPNNDNTDHINQDHIPEGFCVKVHTVVGNIGQLMIEDDLNILSDLMNIPAPWLSLCISHSTAHPNQYWQVGYCGCGTHLVSSSAPSSSLLRDLFLCLQPNPESTCGKKESFIPAAAAAPAATIRLVHHISCVRDTTRTPNISSPTYLNTKTTQQTPKNHPQRTESSSQKVQGRSRERDGRDECNHERSQATQEKNQSEKESSQAICNRQQLTTSKPSARFPSLYYPHATRTTMTIMPTARVLRITTDGRRPGEGFQTATGVEGGRETLMNKFVELGIETLEHLWSLWAPAMPVRLAMCSSGDYSNNVG